VEATGDEQPVGGRHVGDYGHRALHPLI
jgi:hypothetical protein